ncbi:uncharacterized protein L969DRAFT_15838 [Mixia osmundae IAM 14324]|uniref:uncharacterized protein n=1 Tax=Mixia osmundae (strain CBS 9802 / IAM 14324 / JCM 22182 / KY 12970) TaxID=764103 RepID=UPI0004A54AD8|nr:uncharacterized protein L969DRAFT_15838 [Mixia osmundae IAM 14324]KEI40479.1 hypothetical protein L969DRAFT_15838 [Mixia osmundae IAM 14324]
MSSIKKTVLIALCLVVGLASASPVALSQPEAAVKADRVTVRVTFAATTMSLFAASEGI